MSEERGCGERVEGGVYMMAPLTAGPGRPVEDFLICPPVPIPDPEAAGISPVGVKVQEVEGTVHVVDWIGSEHYPLVTDFVEEAKRLGISRRLPLSFPFRSLSSGSQMILLHKRAYIDNWKELDEAIFRSARGSQKGCPIHVLDHAMMPRGTMCAALWWDDAYAVTQEEMIAALQAKASSQDPDFRTIWRKMPSFGYEVRVPPHEGRTDHTLAIFARFPIIRLEVVADPNNGTHEEALDKIGRCSLPVALVKD